MRGEMAAKAAMAPRSDLRGELVRRLPDPAALIVWAIPVAVLTGLWIAWAADTGGYFSRSWYPGALLVVAVLGIVGIARSSFLPEARAPRLALGIFGALVAWAWISLFWDSSLGSGWEAANQVTLYLATGALVSLTPWTAGRAYVLLGLWSLGVAVVCAISLAHAASADELSKYFYELRYQDPVGYVNGNAALAVTAFLAALPLTFGRAVPWWARGPFTAVATFLLAFSLLSQSRGSFVGLAVAVPLFVIVTGDRLRFLPRLLIVAGAVALAAGPVFDVQSVGETGKPIGDAVHHAATSIGLATVIALAAGTLVAALERAAADRAEVRRQAGRVGLVAATVLALVVLAGVAVNAGRLAHRAHTEFSTLTHYKEPKAGDTRYSNLDPYERPDYWRVALHLFSASPVQGRGVGSFEREYTARRHESKPSRYTHNLFLRTLSEGGLVGAALFVAFVLGTLGLVLARVRSFAPDVRLVGAGCLAVGAYFIVHGSFDWLDVIPAVAAPATALAFLALALSYPERTLRGGPSDTAIRVSLIGGTVAVVLALASMIPAYLAVRYVDLAFANSGSDNSAAFRAIRRAQWLNPVSITPRISEGTIALNAREYERAAKAFRESLKVEDNWYARFELCLIDSHAGRAESARRQLAAASRLNAHDPAIASIRADVHKGARLDPAEVNRSLSAGDKARFTTRQE